MKQQSLADIQMITTQILQGMKREPLASANAGLQKLGNAPVAALVDRLIEEAAQARASDIHIEPQAKVLRIRLRIDGNLCERHELPLAVHVFLVSRIKIISSLDITEKRIPQDGRFFYLYNERRIDIRVSTMPVMDGEKIVLRLLNATERLLSMDELGFSLQNKKLFRTLCHRPYGMVINSGPVNSGKTTTLYAALHELNDVSKNIVTLEDPVEYSLPGINQIQVSAKGKLTFPLGLRSVLRQDPNIIMIGEIRDSETAEIAVRAALTGHLVFTTLHTNGALGCISRLLDMGIEPYLLAAALQGVLAQRLVRRICPSCREEFDVLPGSLEAYFLAESYHLGQKLLRGRGCPACNWSGYKGRIPIHEVLFLDEEFRLALQEKKDILQLRELAGRHLTSMKMDGKEKILAGYTTISEVVSAIDDDSKRS